MRYNQGVEAPLPFTNNRRDGMTAEEKERDDRILGSFDQAVELFGKHHINSLSGTAHLLVHDNKLIQAYGTEIVSYISKQVNDNGLLSCNTPPTASL